MSSIELTGFDELIRALEEMPRQTRPLAKKAMDKSLKAVRRIVSHYPAQPSRTRAKTFNTYMRGIGRFPRGAFVGGKRRKRGAYDYGKVYETSEQLGKRWKTKTQSSGATVEGTISNAVSYADFVQGEQQVDFHAETGWVTLDDAVEQARPKIDGFFDNVLDRVAESFNG